MQKKLQLVFSDYSVKLNGQNHSNCERVMHERMQLHGNVRLAIVKRAHVSYL